MLESSHIPEQQVPHYRTYIKSLGSHELIQEYRAVTDGSPISKYRSNNLRETRESKIIP